MEGIMELVRDLRAALMEEVIRLEWQRPTFITREITTGLGSCSRAAATRFEVPIDFRRGRSPRPLWKVRPDGWTPRG